MRIHSLLAGAALLSACLGGSDGATGPEVGQSGSEFGDDIGREPGANPVPPGDADIGHCPCDTLAGLLAVHAEIIDHESFPDVGAERYTLRALALLSDDPLGRDEIAVGDSFGGYLQGGLPCGGEVEVEVGDEVAAFFRRGHQDGRACCELLACFERDDCYALEEDAEAGGDGDPEADDQADQGDLANTARARCERTCAEETEEACVAHQPEAVLHGELTLLPWADALVVGRSESAVATLDPDEIPLLSDRDRCREELSDGFAALYPPEPDTDAASSSGEAGAADAGAARATSGGDAEDPGASEDAVPPPPESAQAPANQPDDEQTPQPGPTTADGGMADPSSGTNPAREATPPPEAGDGVNMTGAAEAPPPAHPEEIRARCGF